MESEQLRNEKARNIKHTSMALQYSDLDDFGDG